MRRLGSFALPALLCVLVAAIGVSRLRARLPLDQRRLASALAELQGQDQTKRDRAAADIRAIVARYPSHTVNITEPDGGEARWKAALQVLKPGITEPELVALLALAPGSMHLRNINGRSPTGLLKRYRLDHHWVFDVDYQPPAAAGMGPTVAKIGPPMPDEEHMLVAPDRAKGFSGIWRQYYANGQLYDETPLRNARVVGSPVIYDVSGKPMGSPVSIPFK